MTAGVVGMTLERGYRNGLADGVDFGAATGVVDQTIHIASRKTSGAPAVFLAGNVQAFAIYDITLTAAQMLALTNAVNAL